MRLSVEAHAAAPGTMCARLHDERGASIIMALVFFLICAIIGSVVLTAASVSAKEVQTHKELQEAEFAMGSAAQAIGHELGSITLTCPSPTAKPLLPGGWDHTLALARDFWDQNGEEVMRARANGASVTYPLTIKASLSTNPIAPEVYGKMTIDADLNITVDLSLDPSFSAESPYNMTVSLQCIPTYDSAGTLKSFSYESAVITKTGGA